MGGGGVARMGERGLNEWDPFPDLGGKGAYMHPETGSPSAPPAAAAVWIAKESVKGRQIRMDGAADSTAEVGRT